MSAKVFIDLGAYNGDTLEIALKIYKNLDRFYAFEPIAELFEIVAGKFKNQRNIILINAAADVRDGKGRLYLGSGASAWQASSLCIGKSDCFADKFKIVDTVDFSKFITDSFSLQDKIILKLDVEGKEYDILEKMIRDRSLEYIHKIYCEWHYKSSGIPKQRHLNLMRRLRKKGFNLAGNELDDFSTRIKRLRSLSPHLPPFKYNAYRIKCWLIDKIPTLYFSLRGIRDYLREGYLNR